MTNFDLKGKHILLADDEEDIRNFLTSFLTRKGIQVTTAENGREALNLIKAKQTKNAPYDLLLTDIKMPELDGLELISEIKKQNLHLPIVVMTGFGDKPLLVELLKKDIDDYLDKLVDPNELWAILTQVLEKIETQKNLNAQKYKKLQFEKDQETLRLMRERDTSNFFSSVFYFFVLANLDEKPVEDILDSAHAFLRDEMKLDTALMMNSGLTTGSVDKEELELFKTAAKEGNLIFKTAGYRICTVPPLQILVRKPPKNLDVDKLDVFASAAASRLIFATHQDNQYIMNEVLGEAVFMVNYQGKIEPGATNMCLKMFQIESHEALQETSPGELLYGKTEQAAPFEEWITLCFTGPLSFAEMLTLRPTEVTTASGRILEMNILPINDKHLSVRESPLRFILFQCRDITLIRKHEKELEHIEESNKAVILVIEFQSAFIDYCKLIKDHLSTSEKILSASKQDLIRNLHTVKGMSGVFSLNTIQTKCHDCETQLKELTKYSAESDVVRSILTISEFLERFQEEHKNVFNAIFHTDNHILPIKREWLEYLKKRFFEKRDFSEKEVSNFIKQMTYIPVQSLFKHFDKLLQDLAASRGKMLQPLVFQDEQGIFVPEGVLSKLVNSMTHLFRNSVDHGIETPDVRWTQKKEEYGCIRISVNSDAEHLILSVEDDGQGIDSNKLKMRAVSKGLITSQDAAQMSETQLKQLVFVEGLSTKEKADMVSGRGVGMGDVKNSCDRLGARLDFQTVQGQGTTWIIEIPLRSVFGAQVSSDFFCLRGPSGLCAEY
ncbi:response regulator [Deltaproteobacteria bacterium TL4]